MARRAAKPKPAPARPVAIDARAPGVVLAYAGGRTGRYVPARDLTGPDLGRIAYRRAADVERASRSLRVRPGEPRPEPKRAPQPSPKQIEALADELVGGGAFSRIAAPAAEPEPAPPAEPTEA